MNHAEIEVAGEVVRLLAGRAAFWCARRTLIVADLHLGKSETFRAAGVPVPAGDADEQLARLGAIILAMQAERVIVVGDLLHAPSGLSASLCERVERWRARHTLPVIVVPGNHDRGLDRVAEAWRLTLAPGTLDEGVFAFCHDPETPNPAGRFCWAGHLHPAVRLRLGAERLRLSCFWIHAGGAVLPAFSRFTGGAPVRPKASDRVFALTDDEILEAPAHAWA